MENSFIYSSSGAGYSTLESLEDALKYNFWIGTLIAPYLGKNNLELGAGTGTISNILLREFPIYLMEPERDTRAELQRRFYKNNNLKGIHSRLDENPKIGLLDCIYSSNVLEHIENDLELIEKSLYYLKIGGFFVAIVPGGGRLLFSHFDNILGHVRRYTWNDRKRIRGHLENLGIEYKIITYRYFNPISAVGWFFKMKMGGATKVAEKDVQNAELLMPIQKFINNFPLPFGQNIFMVIQKLI